MYLDDTQTCDNTKSKNGDFDGTQKSGSAQSISN